MTKIIIQFKDDKNDSKKEFDFEDHKNDTINIICKDQNEYKLYDESFGLWHSSYKTVTGTLNKVIDIALFLSGKPTSKIPVPPPLPKTLNTEQITHQVNKHRKIEINSKEIENPEAKKNMQIAQKKAEENQGMLKEMMERFNKRKREEEEGKKPILEIKKDNKSKNEEEKTIVKKESIDEKLARLKKEKEKTQQQNTSNLKTNNRSSTNSESKTLTKETGNNNQRQSARDIFKNLEKQNIEKNIEQQNNKKPPQKLFERNSINFGKKIALTKELNPKDVKTKIVVTPPQNLDLPKKIETPAVILAKAKVNTVIEKKNIELSENLSQTATKINVENKDTKPNLVIETQKNPEQKSATTVIELISPINNRTPENKKETTEDSTKKEIPETKNSDQKLVTKNNGTEGLLKNTVITVSATESKKSQDLLKQTNIELTAINKTGSTTNFFNVSTSSTTINNNQTIITENPSAKLSLQQEDKAPSCLSWFFCLGKRNTKNDEKEHLLKNQTPN